MTRNPAHLLLNEHLDYLKLTSVKENCQPLAVESAANHWSHLDYLGRLLKGEVAARNSARLPGGSKPPVFQSSRPWKASVGTGPKKSIGSRSRISSGLGLSKRKPTLFSWVWLA